MTWSLKGPSVQYGLCGRKNISSFVGRMILPDPIRVHRRSRWSREGGGVFGKSFFPVAVTPFTTKCVWGFKYAIFMHAKSARLWTCLLVFYRIEKDGNKPCGERAPPKLACKYSLDSRRLQKRTCPRTVSKTKQRATYDHITAGYDRLRGIVCSKTITKPILSHGGQESTPRTRPYFSYKSVVNACTRAETKRHLKLLSCAVPWSLRVGLSEHNGCCR